MVITCSNTAGPQLSKNRPKFWLVCRCHSSFQQNVEWSVPHLKVAHTFPFGLCGVQHCWNLLDLSRAKTGQILGCVRSIQVNKKSKQFLKGSDLQRHDKKYVVDFTQDSSRYVSHSGQNSKNTIGLPLFYIQYTNNTCLHTSLHIVQVFFLM